MTAYVRISLSTKKSCSLYSVTAKPSEIWCSMLVHGNAPAPRAPGNLQSNQKCNSVWHPATGGASYVQNSPIVAYAWYRGRAHRSRRFVALRVGAAGDA